MDIQYDGCSWPYMSLFHRDETLVLGATELMYSAYRPSLIQEANIEVHITDPEQSNNPWRSIERSEHD